MKDYNILTQELLQTRLLSQVHDILVLTDEVAYPGVDQVFPMYPEQPFFLDELVKTDMRGAQALEIGLGSGVLSIGALKAGAKHVTALEINPRAKVFAGFNAVLNGVSDGLRIIDGNTTHIWEPVKGQTFDYIMSNPPFMPSPPNSEHYYHSGGGGILGMDFMNHILSQLDDHLVLGGRAQIVTAAPGDDKLPTALMELMEIHLSGTAELVIDPIRFSFDVLQHHLPDSVSDAAMTAVSQELQAKGITHQYLCVMHYVKQGQKTIATRFCEPHPRWDEPLTTRVS
jgi:release factor glutamine methyltransferase